MRLISLNIFLLLSAIVFLIPDNISAQEADGIHWLSFEALEDSLKANPKPVFIEFYADWCVPCRKMARETFREKHVVELLNTAYYAVRMNVETADTIHFGGQKFVNENSKRVNSIHQIPLLMASRKDSPFTLPAMVIFDEKFEAKARYFQFLDAEQLKKILQEG